MVSYYVSTSGNDNNNGSISSPWRTIQKAANVVNAGDVVSVRGGTYYERVSISRSGSSGSYITFQSYQGEIVIVDANGKVNQWEGAIYITNCSYIQFIGFNVINSYWCGIWVHTCNNVNIKNCIVHEIQRSGLYAQNSSYITYDGCEVYNTQLSSAQQQNENVNMINVTNFEIKYCYIHNTARYESIDVKQGGGSGTIHHNRVYPNESAGIYIDSQGQSMSYIDTYNNYVSGGGYGVRGIAYAVEVSGSLQHCKIYNNICNDTGAAGIVASTSYSVGTINDISVINNTVYNCGWDTEWGGGIRVEYGSATNIIIRNNISYNNGGSGGNLLTNSNTTLDKNLIGTNPNFVNPSAADFHLQSGSPAINAGSSTQFVPSFDYDGNSRPYGSVYDVGAYEYGSGAACPTLTVSLSIT